MKTLTVDYLTWRAGGDKTVVDKSVEDFAVVENPNCLGEGDTQLLNLEGFMCCLGHIAPQLEPSLTPFDLRDVGNPEDLNKEVFELCELLEEDNEDTKFGNFKDTELSTKAISINDDYLLTNSQRMAKLIELFKQHGYELKFINTP